MKEKKKNFIKIENFSFVKDTVRIKRQAADWMKVLQNTSDKGLMYTKYSKNFQNSTVRRQTTLASPQKRNGQSI